MSKIHIGRLLRANTRMCVAGCPAGQLLPAFGSLVSIPLSNELIAYGLVMDIHIDDDGLVRQLAVSGSVPDEVIEDNRINRNVPVELSVLFIGHAQKEKISHLLPPQPPLSLDNIYSCSDEEIRKFTSAGRLGYFRHILAAEDVSTADQLAAHLLQAGNAHVGGGNDTWLRSAVREIITLLRDDHAVLSAVLSAIADAFPEFAQAQQGEGR
jgi:hypothetical protein